jgi:hypothetical protein
MTLIITHCEKPGGGGPIFNENVISGAFGTAKIAVSGNLPHRVANPYIYYLINNP